MEQLVSPAVQWTVSVHGDGDTLAVRVGGLGLELGFVGAPSGFAASEIETWLSELIGVAGLTGSESPALAGPAESTAIPRTLHQALSGLLFYEAELWGTGGTPTACALACVAAGDTVALGWSGAGEVEVLLGGRPFEPAWAQVRDPEGRTARALVVDASLRLEARLRWPSPANGGWATRGEIAASWPGLAGAMSAAAGLPGSPGPVPAVDERERAPAAVEPPTGTTVAESAEDAAGAMPPAGAPVAESGADAAGTEPSADAPVAGSGEAAASAETSAGEERRSARQRGAWHFRSWMDRLAGQGGRDEEERVEPIAHDVPGVPDLLPEPTPSAAPATVAERAEGEAAPPAPASAEPRPSAAVEEASDPRAAAVDPFDLGPLAAARPEPVVEETVLSVETVAPIELPAPPPQPAIGSAAADASPGPVAESVATRPRPAVRRPEWPEPEQVAPVDGRPLWRRRWFVAAVVLALFASGWLLGQVDFARGMRDLGRALTAVGLGPARYEVHVTSRPSGAWIAVDGVDLRKRTPATIEVKPGRHDVVLSFSGVGGSKHSVEGRRGQRVAVDAELWGSLKVTAPPGSGPISVAVDGMQRGYLPLDVGQLQPGIHRLQFSGPGVTPWEQNVEVHVEHTAEVLAQPVLSPSTGVLEVRATLADEAGSEPVSGAQVWIDGQPAGVTPLRLELSRGPHSIRVRYRDDEAPVQVIDLPGGNLRYATIQLGLDLDAPRLAAALPERIPVDRPTVLSASLPGAREGDVREMWLHVRTPEGAWRRYVMTLMKAPGGLVGVAVFPTALFDGRGRTSWYVSAATPMGDEYFTEMKPAQAAAR